MDCEPLPAPTNELCDNIQAKLQRWCSLGEAPEYLALENRCARFQQSNKLQLQLRARGASIAMPEHRAHYIDLHGCAFCDNRGPHKPTVCHPLNRFGGNMGPYADSLLPLKSVEYINASPIDNLGEGAPWFVATMCPKRETFAHFWSMVWELGTRVIINLTHERDRVGSGPSDKRERYWPPLDEASERAMAKWPVQPYTLFTESCEQVPALLRYAIELRGPQPKKGGARRTRVVALYWYSRWVDFPSSTSIGSRPFYANAWAVLHIAMHIASEIESLGAKHWSVCHCSAGVGRTGTFIALLQLLRLLPTIPNEEALDKVVSKTIETMRDKRLWMVKTDIEYATLYAAIMLRLKNPDALQFQLTWPLKDGARTVPLEFTSEPAAHMDEDDDDDASADAMLPPPTPAAISSAPPPSPHPRAAGRHSGFGSMGASGSAAAPSPRTPGGSQARPTRPSSIAGGNVSMGCIHSASAEAANSDQNGTSLKVRTPEDEDEMTIDVDDIGHPGISGASREPDDSHGFESIDNTADVAHYTGVR